MISNSLLERAFQLLAAALIAVAVYFYLNGNYERVFVSAVIGSLCFFISIRFQVKERLQKRADHRKLELDEADELADVPSDVFEHGTSERDN